MVTLVVVTLVLAVTAACSAALWGYRRSRRRRLVLEYQLAAWHSGLRELAAYRAARTVRA